MVKNNRIILSLLAVFFILSCSKDNDDILLKDSNKKINSFIFNINGNEIKGKIDDINKTISVKLPFCTELSALTPSITASNKAKVLPESGVL